MRNAEQFKVMASKYVEVLSYTAHGIGYRICIRPRQICVRRKTAPHAFCRSSELSDKAVKIYDAAMNIGWDKEYGGIFYFKDYLGKPVEAYEHDMKLWWPHNEAVIASLMLYKKTGDEKYFKNFEILVDYAFSAFSDPEYDEWFGYLRRDGKPTEPPCKGHTYKGFFHVARMLHKGKEILTGLVTE